MTIARINKPSDATWARGWEVADATERATLMATFLATGGPKRGDMIIQLDTATIYVVVGSNLSIPINPIDLVSNVINILPLANGGTGLGAIPDKSITYSDSGITLDFSSDFKFDDTGGGLINNALLDISGAAGGRIIFPATQVPSSNANTLDDYEEGTWTPSIAFGGGTTGITYATQVGSYIKIGQLVFASFRIDLTNKGSSTGAATVEGLPFTSSAIANVFGAMVGGGSYANFAGLTSTLTGLVNNNAINAALQHGGATGTADLDDTNFTNTSVLISAYLYRAAA